MIQECQETFRNLRQEFIWLRTCFNTYDALFESGPETENLLRRTAPLFFQELNVVLIEYAILQASRITEGPSFGKRKNLSVAHMNELLAACHLLTEEIEDASNRVRAYGDLIAEARNRVISHADKETIASQFPTSTHMRSDVDRFLADIQEYSDMVGVTVGEGPLDFSATSGPGDVYDLLRLLRSAA